MNKRMIMARHLAVCGVLACVLSACASGPPSYEQNIRSAISGASSLFILYPDDDVIVLTGWVEDRYTKNAVLRAASQNGNERRVVDRIRIQDDF